MDPDLVFQVAIVEVSVSAVLEDGTTATVQVVDAANQVMLVDVIHTVVSAIPVEPVGATAGWLQPWTDLTAVEAPEAAPVVAQHGARYAVGVLYPTGHPGTPGTPTAPADPQSVYLELPLAPQNNFEFFWRDRDSGFSAAAFLRILPADGATYLIDGYPAADGGLIVDVKDFNHGLVYSVRTNSWAIV